MARHSKWHKVKQFKGAIDAKRSASFTKLAREITVATREKGSDPEMNARLRAAVTRAREGSMPKDAIERAIARGSGAATDGAQIEELTYEGYAPGGTALIIESLTDNRNRTANEIKHMLSKAGGSLAATGSVTYLFDHVGFVRIAAPLTDPLELRLIDAGASNIEKQDDGFIVYCAPQDLGKLTAAGGAIHELPVRESGFEWLPKTTVETDEETGVKVEELIEQLESHDDVKQVFSNLA